MAFWEGYTIITTCKQFVQIKGGLLRYTKLLKRLFNIYTVIFALAGEVPLHRHKVPGGINEQYK
jgi:hypothetical protein